MGTPLGGGGGDGQAFIIKLKFRHVKHFMIVLPLQLVWIGKKPGWPQPGDRRLP